jgi:thioesterase domain-containing protein
MEEDYFRSRKQYAGRIVLFTAGETLAEMDASFRSQVDPLLGWSSFVGGDISIHRIAGDHHDILREPGLTQMADRLRKHLADAQREEEPIR